MPDLAWHDLACSRQIPATNGILAQPDSAIKKSPDFLKGDRMSNEKDLPRPSGGKSPPVTRHMAIEMRKMRAKGMAQHDIAASFGVNQGRVCEVLKGRRFPDPDPQGKLF